MQIQNTNPTGTTKSQQNQQNNDVVPLNARVSETQPTAATSTPDNTNELIEQFVDLVNRTCLTEPTPRALIDLLMGLRNEDGTPALTSPGKMTSILTQSKAVMMDAEGGISPELDDAFMKAGIQLFSMNYFVQKFIEKAIFPTEENGGMIREYY